MRFETKFFNIDDLYLDEGNYRFNSADDQSACIQKIYRANPASFANLMESLATDNLGELLLVFDDVSQSKRVVMDGNRRLSALKVLHNPQIAPTPAIQRKAELFKNQCKTDFSRIGVQVSDDRDTIMRTIYERHAAAGGLRRQDWSALAAARFRYAEGEQDTDWRVICLLLETERKHPKFSDFIDSSFSYEVFKRIAKAAFSKNYINPNVFKQDGRGMKIRPKDLYDQALEMACNFLNALQNKELSLSRKDKEAYADSKTVEKFLERFDKAPITPSKIMPEKANKQPIPEVQQTMHPNKSVEVATPSGVPDKKPIETTTSSSASDNKPVEIAKPFEAQDKSLVTTSEKVGKAKTPQETQFVRCQDTIDALDALGNIKLSALYNSVTSLYVTSHTALVHVGCWTLFEVAAVALGKSDMATSAFIKSQMNNFYFKGTENKKLRQELSASVELFVDRGNSTKHSRDYIPDPHALIHHFDNADLVLRKMLEALVAKTKES